MFRFNLSVPSKILPSWEAHLQWKNSFDEPSLKITNEKGASHFEIVQKQSVNEALKHLITFLLQGEMAVIDSMGEVDAIGHRIVHGGKYFSSSVRITPEVKEKIQELSELAPLHNSSELESICILEEYFKNTPQFAVFDTSFHHTIPEKARIYPGLFAWYEEGIMRYGFHGISFQYCARRCTELLNPRGKDLKIVICHLGSGSSLCAVQDGKSIDTTMGFTPLDGLMMDTRSGSIDPGIILYLLEKKQKSYQEISQDLYQRSGLLGISGISSDMRDIIRESVQGNFRAQMALDIYIHRLNALIGSMVASLKGVDALVFTAGIGENASLIREKVCDSFSFLGVQLDLEKNRKISLEDRILSSEDSQVKVLLIHTQEAQEIALECFKKNTLQKK